MLIVMERTNRQVKDLSSGIAFDPSDHSFVVNPYPRYAELREAPVLHRTAEDLWVLTRHEDVMSVLRDARMSSDPRHLQGVRAERRQDMPLFGEDGPKVMLFADPPDHSRLRRLANKAFTPAAVNKLRPEVERMVNALIRAGIERDPTSLDLMVDLAEPLPVLVICRLLGVPSQDHHQFKPWSTAIARVLDPSPDPELFDQAVPAVVGFISYFGDLIEKRRADPRDDLLSALIQAESNGESLTTSELFAMIILLFVAGHETTTNLLGNGMLALLRHRDQLDWLRRNPEQAAKATEELLRYDSPVQLTARTATTDLELNGLELEKGEGVICALAAANRDPRYVEDPDCLLLARGKPTHLAFGNGLHHCLGAPLARLEGATVFPAIVRCFPSMELSDDHLVYRDHFVLRGLSSLPVSLGVIDTGQLSSLGALP